MLHTPCTQQNVTTRIKLLVYYREHRNCSGTTRDCVASVAQLANVPLTPTEMTD